MNNHIQCVTKLALKWNSEIRFSIIVDQIVVHNIKVWILFLRILFSILSVIRVPCVSLLLLSPGELLVNSAFSLTRNLTVKILVLKIVHLEFDELCYLTCSRNELRLFKVISGLWTLFFFFELVKALVVKT